MNFKDNARSVRNLHNFYKVLCIPFQNPSENRWLLDCSMGYWQNIGNTTLNILFNGINFICLAQYHYTK